MRDTAKMSAPNTVRIVWTGSIAIELGAPKNGVDTNNLHDQSRLATYLLYAQSKCGNFFLGSEFAKSLGGDGILSVVGSVKASAYDRS